MAGSETRERILEAAETLFAEQGISGTSLRALTRAADVNLAAVHYHFGSKEGLLDSVVARRAGPLNRERLAELDRLEARSENGTPGIEDILAALFTAGTRELLAVPETSRRLARLIARIDAQPPEVVEPLYRKHFGELGRRFVEALQRALPELPVEVVSDRYRFSVGVLSFLFSGNFDLDVVPGHPAHATHIDERIDHAIVFLAAGMRAPLAHDPRAHPRVKAS
ncbi:MAG: TetR family transcriptional regulator [Proteobacteria bacterium]|nr:TetR family transcriptional regulator [Pseudomonadota bacterium]MCZ6784316.1 TetR family transcriptional regulator [Pseudomonadota bacterium]